MTIDLKQMLAQRVTEAGGRLTVKSALNPALWLCAIVSIPAFLISTLTANPPWWSAFLVISPVIIAMFGFVVLLFLDRDKLQSEDFQIKKRTLELIEQKGMAEPIPFTTLEELVNPDLVPSSTLSMEGK